MDIKVCIVRYLQSLAGYGKTEVRQPISHDRSRRISGSGCEMGARPRFFRNLLVLLGCFTLSWQLGRTQNSGAVPARIGEVKTSGSLRTRVESWNWFEGSANNDYTYAGSILRFSF